mmetsp:Transcript_1325/g.1508  ORF Transcript_1325/g.1508 Transcript_1325/m.1508 type:complete len:157 (-) Transcript_1325:2223-2693(-)
MFALKRVIEGDRWRRILSSTNNRSLLYGFTMNEGIFSFYRAYTSLIQSQNVGTYWSSCSNEEDSLKNTTLLARSRSITTITTQSSNNILLSQQPGRFFSYHNSRNKFHFDSLFDESRALMTTSTPSSTSSSSSQPSSSQSSEKSTRKKNIGLFHTR